MKILRTAWRQLHREWRSGALTILLASLIVAAAAVSTVGFLTSRVDQAMRIVASTTLAADIDIHGPTPLLHSYTTLAQDKHLETTTLLRFVTVALSDQHSQLAEIHAVAQGYPLRGQVELAPTPSGTPHPTSHIPARGTAWVAPRILTALHVHVGDTIRLGASRFKIAAVLVHAPGQGINFIEFAPNVYLNKADIPATNLIQRGSRVDYHLLVAGSSTAIAQYKTALKKHLRESDRIKTLDDAPNVVKKPFRQAQSFLRLAALISILIAAIAVALSARQYAVRRTDAVAIRLSLGMTRSRLMAQLSVQLLLLGLISAIIGSLIGYGAETGLAAIIGNTLPVMLPPPPGWTPALSALGTVILLLIGFALAPILQLKNTPPARILRRDLAPQPMSVFAVWGCAIAALFALLAWQLSDTRSTLYVLAAIVAIVIILSVGALILLRVIRPLRGFGSAWRFGFGNLSRRGGVSILHVAAFGLGITVLLSLTLVRSNVFNAWQTTLPPDTPNEFIFNIQPAQRAGLQQFMRQHELPTPSLYSMTRARLVAINGKHVTPADFSQHRAKSLLKRQANLSVARFRRQENVMTAGTWWKQGYGKKLVSVDQDTARAFNVTVGDTLTFALDGAHITLKIANLRNIRWQSFDPNFFFVVPPGVLKPYPKTYITSIHVPRDKTSLLPDMARALPGVTVINVGAIIHTVRQIVTQASLAIAYVFLFTVLASILVLLAAIQTTRDQRRYESALLRTLGASRVTIIKGLVAEFATLGLLAGGLGGLISLGAGWVLINKLFELPYHPNPWIIPAGLIGGIVIIAGTGIAATWQAINRPPIETLTREP